MTAMNSPDLFGDGTLPALSPSWRDPHPLPPIEWLDDHTCVVRDDTLPGGTKRRALDYLIGHDSAHTHTSEWVYGESPAWGYAQWALALTCATYQKHAVIFMADRAIETRHRLQNLALEAGAHIHWVPNGMLSVTRARARAYVAANPTHRTLLPMGGDTPLAQLCLRQTMERVREILPRSPTVIWSVLSSGTLSRALQATFPAAEVHGVIVGHTPTPEQAGRAILHQSPYAFANPIKVAEKPPYPSAAEYDAKAWPVFCAWRTAHSNVPALIWNVGS